MSRWIDADHLRKWILSWWERTEPASEYIKGKDILDQIDREPSIDLVRCAECKWAKANGTYQWCGRLDSTARITADDFCSYGERRASR